MKITVLNETARSRDMKQILESLWKWAVIIALIALSYYALSNTHSSIARDPYSIEKITGLDLPKITSVETEENEDRTSSAWDCFIHHAHFAEDISAGCISELERLCETDSLHWTAHEDGSYTYTDDAWSDGGYYSITCSIYKDSSVVTYYVEEMEGALVTLLGFMTFAAACVWGISIIASAISRRKTK